MNPGGYWYGYGYQQPQVPLRKGWTKKVPGPSQFGTFHAYYSPTTGLSGGGKWGAEAVRAKVDSNPVGALQELCQKVKVVPFYQEVVGAPRHTVQVNLPSGEIAYGQDGNKKTAKRKAAKNMLDILDGKGGQGEEEQEGEEEEEEQYEEQYEEEAPEQPAGTQDGAGPSAKPEDDDSSEEEDVPPGPQQGDHGRPAASFSNRHVDHNQSLTAKLKNMHRGNLGTGRFAGVFNPSTFVPPTGSDAVKALTYQPQAQGQYATQYERHLAIVEAQRKHQVELIKQQCEYGPLGVKLWFSKEESSKVDSDEEETEASKPNRAPEEDHVTHRNAESEYTRKDPEEASFTKKEFTIQEPLKPIVPETLEEWLANIIMKETNRRIDKKAKKREKKRLEALREEMAGEGKSMGDIEDLLKQSKEEEPDFICKMCNLVFVSRKHYEVHKVTSDHLHVVKGFFPGEGGYHCFLCWLSFQQAEGLLNHIERNNHLEKCERKGVLRIWMAPTKVSDMDMFKTFRTVAGQRAGRIGERRRTRSRSRSRRSRERSKRPRLDSRERDMGERLRQRERSKERSRRPSPGSLRPKKGRGGKGGDLADNANLVPLGPSRSKGGEDVKSERDSWYADPEARSVEDRQKCESFEWNDVKGSALLDEDEKERKKALKKEKESLRREKEALKASSSSRRSRDYDSRPSSSRHHDDDRPSSSRRHDDREEHYRRSSKSSHRESERASGSSRHREEEIGGSYWESHSGKLDSVEEESRRRRVKVKEEDDRGSRVKVKKEKKDKEKRKERRHSKRSSHDGVHEGYHDDHEEVNEVQDGFEVDSVGQVENSEETLQKMKSAIIGILDEEIFTLAKKIKD